MHTLWQHPNGTFYVLHGRRQKQRTSLRTKDGTEAKVRLGQFIAAEGTLAPTSPTIGRILLAYRDDRLPEVRGQAQLRVSVDALNRHLGDLLPEHLSPAVLKRYARERGVGPGTVLREVGVLRAALQWAVNNKWIAWKPEIPNPVQAPPPRERWITRDEARRLVAACREPHVRLFVLLGLMTLARMSAILEAKLEQVDWERRTINYGVGHGNKRRALVPLNDQIFEALKGAKELSCSGYIVEYRGGPVATVKNGFRAACDRAGLEDVTPHILRHSGATWLASDGVPLAEIARMLGDSEKTTERVYAKHSPTYLRRAANALQFSIERTDDRTELLPEGLSSAPTHAA